MSTSQATHQSGAVWEERWHPLREEWVVVAAHRQNRPWIGATVKADDNPSPTYVADCYLCPGNHRISGAINPLYERTFVFDNDHPCVGPEADADSLQPCPPNRVRPARGLARIICYSPRHDLTMAEMAHDHICEVVQVWQQQTHDLGQRPEVNGVHYFENKGEVVGVSNPHPHGQVYATNLSSRPSRSSWSLPNATSTSRDAGSSRISSRRNRPMGGVFSMKMNTHSLSSPTSLATPMRSTLPQNDVCRMSRT